MAFSLLTRRALVVIRNNHPCESFNVESLARSCGVSRRVLERQFRKDLRESPLGIINQFRINRAKHLLITTSSAITEIAEDIGFADVKSLRHHFRKIVGTTPGIWRREQKSQISLT
ncbi:helix-turn-helix transcriptional regulator [Roseibacillus persicicus]|uniref:helix-turn-helix transcriptional regulator n=1 Tax=Roseibacillus persicicus TaxID=454148 RepID=UPI00280D859E|nr:helix-turn-helix transcriptional regulator [Roseibacillus persicicus]MDQ8191974.1 helix-turn-helix transcriptional regulator [Roseibacillus persicicus]